MKCANCKKEIPQSRIKNNATRYCSEKCHYEFWLNKNKKTFKPKKCKICGIEFMPKTSVNKFCSPRCAYLNDLEKRSKKNGLKKCKNCGKKFEPYTSLDKFCSANCRIENQKKNRSWNWTDVSKINGKNNPAYRNGNYVRGRKKTSVGEKVFIKNGKEIKQSMIDNKGYIYCENCGVSSSLKFECHHIIYRSEKPLHENLHDKKNLIVLCIKCHNLFHKEKSIRNEIVKNRELNKLFGNDVLNK